MTDEPALAARRRRPLLESPLTRRVLAVNVVAPIILVGGLLYLDRYQNELISAELDSLNSRAEMIAAAISEGAVNDEGLPELVPDSARQMIRRLAPPSHLRARLFSPQGELLGDSKILPLLAPPVQVEELAEPEPGWLIGLLHQGYDSLMATRLGTERLPLYQEPAPMRASDFPEVQKALSGERGSALRRSRNRRLLLFTAVPVQRYKKILGSVLVSSSADDIAKRLFSVRLTILEAFVFALSITVLLSVYLASTIARPIRRLAAAADRVRRGRGRRHAIPDLTGRKDEIGELSGALTEMTDVLWRRMDAIEAFAADVAHELKNPLTSLRSAVETVSRVPSDEQRQKLLGIIEEDVERLDRLISDISSASRLDAELSRAETGTLALAPLIIGLTDAFRESGALAGKRLEVTLEPADPLFVSGLESRLGQILRNLLTNALSFSPETGLISVHAERTGDWITVRVEDQGPGIPENKLDAIFERFYSERPSGEKFGTHSGLGLSISRQIAEAHGGRLTASNLEGSDGKPAGARFTLRLPAAPGEC
ncbi:MAG TPA: HAMP domain-containing protein [Rhodospirillaceae bacterium]|nr:HAMP domain-containing protein [Rhodospirillaceae bacterium]